MEAVERDVGATLDEFGNGLSAAVPGGVAQREGRFLASDGQATLEFEVEPLPPRVIALLRLPRLRVRIRGRAGTDRQQADLLERIDRAMHRGGG